MRFYVSNRLSDSILETPEGYLLCMGVPIARTGVQDYLPDEIGEGVEPGPDGLVKVERPEAEVFRHETVASFAGKPVTIDHPGEDVRPDNWKTLAAGLTMNPRRGLEGQADLLLADLLITDERAIALVKAGLREISCGYDTDYEITGPGLGMQKNIIGNHVALVDKGRCGSRCAIHDKQKKEQRPMAGTKKKAGFADQLKRLLGLARVLDALEEAPEEKPAALEEAPEEKDHSPEEMTTLEERLERMEAAIATILKSAKPEPEAVDEDETEDEDDPAGEIVGDEEEEAPETKGQAKDKAKVLDQDVLARAEIVSPGITLDGCDSCTAKRRALSRAYIGDTKALIERFTGGPVKSFKGLDCATLDAAFLGVSEVLRERNNAVQAAKKTKDANKAAGPITPAKLNDLNTKFWADRARK